MERAVALGSRLAHNRDNRRYGKQPTIGNWRLIPPARRDIRKRNNQPSRLGAYFKCEYMEQQIQNYPQQRPAGPHTQPQPPQIGNQAGNLPPANQGRPPAQGRVYGLTRNEAEDAPSVVIGTISLCNHPAYALFDPGAIQSFVS